MVTEPVSPHTVCCWCIHWTAGQEWWVKCCMCDATKPSVLAPLLDGHGAAHDWQVKWP